MSRAKNLTRQCQNRDCPAKAGVATKIVKPNKGKLGFVYYSNQDKQYLHASCRGFNTRKRRKDPRNRWYNEGKVAVPSTAQLEEFIHDLKAKGR